MLLLPNAGECAYDRNPHVGGLHRSLDAKIGGTSGGFVLYFIIFLAVV